MKWQWGLSILVVLGSQALADEPLPGPGRPSASLIVPGEINESASTILAEGCPPAAGGGLLSGNHLFPNFIGYMSNPVQSIDPRAVTAIYPIFGSVWTSADPPIPSANAQAYGPGMTVALGERFALGLNDGAYIDLHLSRNDRARLFALDPQGRFRDVELGGSRTGFTNLGGFAQYTVIEDVENQFLVTGGLRWIAPSGSHELFQGHGPLELAPYVTMGKEFGKFHVLSTTGFQFPAGPGSDNIKSFYATFHVDRQMFGWLYPLVEFNSSYDTKSFQLGLQTRRGFFDLGNFETSGNIVTTAVGANAVLVRERLEVGAVYMTSIATQHGFDVNGLLVKMMLRF